MNKSIEATQRVWKFGRQARFALLIGASFFVLALSQTGCLLTLDQAVYRRVTTFNTYTCRATLVDAGSGEVRMIASDNPALNPLPSGGTRRNFIDYDWEGDGDRDVNDVLLDWRRYIVNNVLPSANFAGRSWCIRPAQTSCMMSGTINMDSERMPPALPDGVPLAECPPTSVPHIEATAPGLSASNQLSFPDTPIGVTSAPVVVTLTNPGTVPLRINRADLLGRGAALDFIKPNSTDTCLPTPDEISRGVGHQLIGGSRCSFNVHFRPQYRPGIGECDRDGVNESCRRTAALEITSEDGTGRALSPLTLSLSGRAIGGRLVVEPVSHEICFSTMPSFGLCTTSRTISIRNDGTRATTGNLTITSATITRGALFTALPSSLSAITLTPGDSVDVQVQFCARSGDTSDAEYTINSSAPRAPTLTVTLVNPSTRLCP